ncbi:hypothetical protein U8P73_33010 (plasmid) [Rhizobium beringeri]|nr:MULTISPECIES: hypothetical protein [Rhizobium]WSG92664.1 hypothetical protein U8P73_33010 [Rhizobium beringeri]
MDNTKVDAETRRHTDQGPVELVEIVHVIDTRRDLRAFYQASKVGQIDPR